MTDFASRDDAHLSAVLDFRADPALPDPPFQQLRAHVHSGIRDGRILPGERLPTVRALAAAAGLAANTVASAYRALEEDGIAEGRGRAGTFVSLDALGDPAARAAAQAYADRIIELGLAPERAQELLRDAFRARG
ncbi:GntR family transcriptional regulator [Leucobacter chromiireducens]|uniref:GntR family transcriptional regulator n=1 Tax=Leucobacter chromiireducens TaxID=283877 RepID=UPI003075B590